MKDKPIFHIPRHRLLSLALLMMQPYLAAQEIDTTDDAVIELSPFSVDASADTGYAATQSLAGTRIKSNLRDVATSVQAVTKDLLNDLGTTSINELFTYTTSTESGGDLGNFTGVPVGGDNIGADAAARAQPQTNLRVRGLGAPDLTRNYFLTDVGFDSYNTERVEINRGANAILFGLGSPAGIVNNTLIKPLYNQNKGVAKVQVGEHGSYRTEFDYNVNLIEDRLSLRFAGVYQDKQYKQRPAFEEKRRIFLTGGWRIDDRSTLQFNVESGDVTANRPSVIAPTDWISGWLLAGKPINDLYYQGTPNVVPGIPSYLRDINDLTQGWAGVPDGIVLDLGEGTTVNSSDATALPVINAPGFFALGALAVYDQAVGSDQVAGLMNMHNTNWPLRGSSAHPLKPSHVPTYQLYLMRDTNGFSNMYGGGATGVEQQGLNSREMFDWVNNLIGGNTADQSSDFETFNASVDRLFLADKSLGIELAYDHQRYHYDAFSPFQDRFSGITIDSNPTLPITTNGVLQPNPNYLRPYVFTRFNRRQVGDTRRNSGRATAYYNLNLEEKFESKWLKWLGEHTVTGVYENQKIQRDTQQLELHHTDPFFARLAGQPIGTGFNTLVNQRIYIGPAVSPNITSMADVALDRVHDITLWDTESTYDYTVWDSGIQPGTVNTRANGNNPAGAEEILRIGGADGFGNIRNVQEKSTAYLINASKSEDLIETSAVNLQSRLFGGNIVTTYGWRRDRLESKKSNVSDFDRDAATNAIIFDSLGIDTLTADTISVDTASWGVVGYLPRRWGELPFGSDISVHYGESENFQPVAGRINHLGDALPDPGGDTKEYGFTVSMLEKKFHVRVNWFETNLTNRSRGYNTGQFINLWSQRPDAWVVGYNNGNGDPDPLIDAGAQLMLAGATAILDSIPPETRELYNIRFTNDSAGNRTGVGIDNVGVTDTEDLAAKGVEMEFIFNPKPNWRIGLNVARQQTTTSNVNPNARIMAEQIQATLDTPVPGYGGLLVGDMPNWFFYGWDPSQSGGLRFQEPGNTFIPETMREWNEPAFRGLRTSLAAEGTQTPEQREWRATLITNYQFREGGLKGLSVGGAFRYESSAIIDYPLVPNADGNLVGDIANPYKNDPTKNFDFWLGYELPFFKEHFTWDVKLNVRNAFTDSDDFVPVSYHQGGVLAGQISRVRYAPQREFFITNTFRF